MSKTPEGIELPLGVYFSQKRKEDFIGKPTPRFEKTEYVVMMFPYGNVWCMHDNIPIDEKWLFSEINGVLVIEHLMIKDAHNPLPNFYRNCYKFMIENPDQIGIHLKRRR